MICGRQQLARLNLGQVHEAPTASFATFAMDLAQLGAAPQETVLAAEARWRNGGYYTVILLVAHRTR